MHIMDGLMSPQVWIAGWVLVLPFLAYALHRLNRSVDERTIPFMAILAAAIFVAQMVNFPILGGTSGHLIGAALITFLLGPFAGIILLTTVLIIQFLFGDGGVTALGLNILNMAVIGSLSAWMVFRIVPQRHRMFAVPLAAWFSVFCAATACALELSLSYVPGEYGVVWWVAMPSMLASHAVIGVGEAIITTGVVLYLAKVAPGTLRMRDGLTIHPPSYTARSYLKAAGAIILIFAVALVGFFIFSASLPDGLEQVLGSQGFTEGTPVFQSPFGYGSNYLEALLAGLLGFGLILAMVLGFRYVAARRKASTGASGFVEIDRYAQRSRFYRFDPRIKIVASIVLVVTLALLRDLTAVVMVLSFVLGAILISAIPFRHLGRSYVLALPLILFASLIMWLTAGAEGALTMFLRISGCVAILALLAASTPFFMLLNALRALKMPRMMVNLVMFTYRFIFVLMDEMERMRTARKARGFSGGRSLADKMALRTISNTVGMTFVRANSRATHIYDALLARGYSGEVRSISRLQARGQDAVLLGSFLGVAFLASMLEIGVIDWTF
jgi:cobalamin biosynthesis protein CbiM